MGNKNYNNNESKLPLNINNESPSKYELIYHFPLFQNDCINSIDIFNDKVAIGTIMGYVFLLRVDKNNLDVKETNDILISSDNSSERSNKLVFNENSKIRNKKSHKKLKTDEEIDKSLISSYANKKLNKIEDGKENQTKDDTSDLTKMKGTKKIKMIRLNSRKEDDSNQNSCTIPSKKRKIKIKNIVIKNIDKNKENIKMQDLTNIDDEEEEKNNEKNEEKNDENFFKKEPSIKEKFSESIKSRGNNKDINSKKFPQVSKLLVEALENICCIQFDTEKYLNISIGDLEIIRMININKFNMNDSNSSLNYMKIKNYDNSNYHFKYCEKAICMMTSTNFLIIFIDFANFLSELSEEKARYDNINLIENRKTSGKILMHNYSVPFDFDGEDFLFVDFLSKEERAICLFDTVKNKLIYSHNISQNFGHISHMKILMNKETKIFLCRNNLQCEIHLLDDKFTCILCTENIKDEVHDALNSLKSVKGFEYIGGNFPVTSFDDIFDSMGGYCTEIASALSDAVQQMETYQNTEGLEKALANFGMFTTKVSEGFVRFGEMILDCGTMIVGGTVNIFSKGAGDSLKKFAAKDLTSDIELFQNVTDVYTHEPDKDINILYRHLIAVNADFMFSQGK